ncbi:MAG TPA: VOC family protein [Kineosporiaceae bacterium]|nr:VOC family protein [Kineosporiaceae bacterium]
MTTQLRVEVFAADLDATVDFYVRVLRFTLERDERDEGYVALRRDAVRVGAGRRAGAGGEGARRPPAGVELVLEVEDLDAEVAHVRAAGWPLDEPVTERPWGLRDVRLLDPDGWYWRLTTG